MVARFAYQGTHLILVVWLCGVSLYADEKPLSSRTSIDQKFRQRLETLAKKCDELGLDALARVSRDWCLDRDRQRQYVFVAGNAESLPADGPDDLRQKWQAKFFEYRRDHAQQLFELARGESQAGSAATAFQLLHEVLRDDPAHGQARNILGLNSDDEIRPRARAARLAHPKFGWQRGRWWQIDSPHFQITTDHSSAAGLELARQLEEFHAVWRQLFYEYWNTPEWLRAQFADNSFRQPPEAKHQVVLFRSRDEYVARLTTTEPQIAVTLGYYLKGNRTSYFYHGDDSLLPVWYHEATHQLFQETGNPVQDVGEDWNFWVVEGVAVYMESLTELSGYYTVGGFDADRLQFLRTRVLSGEPQMPLLELVRLGREDLQKHAEIRRLYTYAAGLVHFLMDFDSGRSRDTFVRYLTTVYLGRDRPESLFAIHELSPAAFDPDWQTFLTVRDADLRYLGPPQRRRNLSLLRGQVSDAALATLASSHELEWIDLSLTKITSDGIRAIGPLKNLKRLSLVGTKVDDSVAPILAVFPQLEELDLSGTAISDTSLKSLGQLGGLKIVRLARTAISDGGISRLAALKQLEELDVENTAVTKQAIAELKRQLPKLK